VAPNPSDALSSLLIVGGRTAEEAVSAAIALSVGNRAMAGTSATVQAPALSPRTPYDAPNWIATDRPVKFGELVDAAALQSYGYTGLLHVPFHTAPDFYTPRDEPFPMAIRYRAPPGPIVDVAASRLDVGINGSYLDTFSLGGPDSDTWLARLLGRDEASRNEHRVGIPVYDVAGSNDLQFYFDARPLHRGDCSAIPNDLRMAIDPDSTIDLRPGYRFTQLPNLALFVNSGFPFTRMADLSQTAVVLPDRLTTEEIGVFLDLMGRLGAVTGTPAVGVKVTRPDALGAIVDRDVLLIGTLEHLGAAGRLLASSPVQVDGARLALALPAPLDTVRHLFGNGSDGDRQRAVAMLSSGLGDGAALLTGGESPLTAGRSVVSLLAAEPRGLTAAMDTLRDGSQAALVQGDVALLSGSQVTSYRVGNTFTVGSLPFWLWPGWALRDQPIGLAGIALAGCVLLGLALLWLVRRRARARRAIRPVAR
jgi:cellulose synthase (UDP-forming)